MQESDGTDSLFRKVIDKREPVQEIWPEYVGLARAEAVTYGA